MVVGGEGGKACGRTGNPELNINYRWRSALVSRPPLAVAVVSGTVILMSPDRYPGGQTILERV